MAAKGSRAFVAAALIMCLLVAAASHAAAAITCGQVAGGVASCYKYLQGLGPPPPPCCAGVQKLNAVAQTPEDRQAACNCLKDLAGRVHGLKPDLALQLPGKCGVSVPYPISTTTDCSKIH